MYYEDDRFNPVNDDDASMDRKKKKDVLSDFKKLDKGYHKIKRKNHKNINRNITIELYTSGDIGCRIRNAVTGQRYSYKVGSSDEDLLFSVKMATGEFGNDAGALFYDNPEQYERHLFVTLTKEQKEYWYSKNLEARITKKLEAKS
jgi:hypothetical protein